MEEYEKVESVITQNDYKIASKGGFPLGEMTSDFVLKSRRNYFATKLFNFYMNSFDTIIENYADFFIIKKKDITFKNVKSNWEKIQEI